MMIDSSAVREMTPGLVAVLSRNDGITRALVHVAESTKRMDEVRILVLCLDGL
jgi:hypothetical protein